MINILIMDDGAEKVSRIKSVLTGMCMVPIENVDVARSLNSGRRKLAEKFYDLLILDLVLPVNDDEEIEPNKSEGFIDELYRIGRLKRPTYVIGLSQYEERVSANYHLFDSKLWKLIHYNLRVADWEQTLQNAVESILTTKEQLLNSVKNQNKYDVGIICALSEEFEQMKIASGLNWKKVNVEGFSNDFFASRMLFVFS